MTRMPVVAGSFYEGTHEVLMKRLNDCFLKGMGPGRLPEGDPGQDRRLKAVIAPHAGYVYSGMTAAQSYIRIFEDGRPETIVIIGPNHTGYGESVAVCEDDWETPLGTVRYDRVLGPAIVEQNEFARSDCIAHNSEHSIEVQLPFLQFIFGEGVSFVPIALRGLEYEVCESLGKTLANLANETDMLVIASSDFTHFESASSARIKDDQALEYLQYMDPKGFLDFVKGHKVSICGAAAITAAMIYANEREATIFNLLKYTNSGDITGDMGSVVAYVAAEVT
ncbi:MAG: AmmeMemoRadiSam system protein B [Candidatus Thorarchaeota archaeon]|nr:MAG: AmmeMemoRadiSam system protein B [Candidatus Thorarchaeota archaeon]